MDRGRHHQENSVQIQLAHLRGPQERRFPQGGPRLPKAKRQHNARQILHQIHGGLPGGCRS